MNPLPVTVLLGTFVFGLGLYVMVRIILKKHYLVLNSMLFWMALTVFMAIFALYPQPVEWAMLALGFKVPANGIFFLSIGFLLFHAFLQSVENAKLKTDLSRLVQDLSFERSELGCKKRVCKCPPR